jgi:hypothetical protein
LCQHHCCVWTVNWGSWHYCVITTDMYGGIFTDTQRVPLVEQELLTFPKNLSSLSAFRRVRVTRSLVLCVCLLDRCLSCSIMRFIDHIGDRLFQRMIVKSQKYIFYKKSRETCKIGYTRQRMKTSKQKANKTQISKLKRWARRTRNKW